MTSGKFTQPKVAMAVLSRHVTKAQQLVKAMIAEDKDLATAAAAWLGVALGALCAKNVEAMMALVSIARLQASKLDSSTRTAANKQWDLWLHGDNKVAQRSAAHEEGLPLREGLSWMDPQPHWFS